MTPMALPASPFQPLMRPASTSSDQCDNPKTVLMASSLTVSPSTTHCDSSSSSLSSQQSDNSAALVPPTGILKIKTQDESLIHTLETLPYRRRRHLKRVRYSTLEIRTYPLRLGDHPGVHGGLPIALDYCQPCKTVLMGMEAYERRRRPRKEQSDDLRLSRTTRRHKLLGEDPNHAPSPQQIRKCLQSVRQIQLQRGWTQRTIALEPIQEGLESIQKAVCNATWNRRQKGKERRMLKAYKSSKSAALAA